MSNRQLYAMKFIFNIQQGYDVQKEHEDMYLILRNRTDKQNKLATM